MEKLIEYTGGSIFIELFIIALFIGTCICNFIVLKRRLKSHTQIKKFEYITMAIVFIITIGWIGFIFGQISVLNSLP